MTEDTREQIRVGTRNEDSCIFNFIVIRAQNIRMPERVFKIFEKCSFKKRRTGRLGTH